MNGTNAKYEVVSEVTDRSNLSDEMASLCAKLPIYRVKKTTSSRKCYTLLDKMCFYDKRRDTHLMITKNYQNISSKPIFSDVVEIVRIYIFFF